jgi:PAS domain S-box-containing protein
MQWQNNPYFIILIIAGLIGLVNTFTVAQRLRVAGSKPLLGMLLSVSLWCFAYSLELATAERASQVFWAQVEYLGIVGVPTFVLLFALEYARHRALLQPRTIFLFWIVPLACLVLVWTNASHGWIWSRIGQKDAGGYTLLSIEHGFAFWIWTAYSYLCLLASTVILIRRMIVSPPEIRPQSLILVSGTAITWAGNIVYLGGFSPIPDLDLTPISFIASMVVFSIGLLRFGILDIMPIAGETVLESLDHVVIVLDEDNRIVYINKAFEYYTGVDPKPYVGNPASAVLPVWHDLSRLVDPQGPSRGEVVMYFEGRDPAYFNARASTVRWRSQRLGRAFVLEDISERRRAEQGILSPGDEGSISSADIPVIFVLRAHDERIVEVNRSFILELGYGRKEAVGLSPLQLGMWDAYQRAEILRVLRSDGQVAARPLDLIHVDRRKKSYLASAVRVVVEKMDYIVILAKPAADDPANAGRS